MRRALREVKGLEHIAAILEKTTVCRLGLCDGDKPYVLPINFAYTVEDGKISIYCHAAREGRKLDIIARNPNTCVETDEMMAVIPGERPCDYSAHYESVIGNGRAQIVTDNVQKAEALLLITRRFGFEGNYTFPEKMLDSVAIIKITLDEVTAKRHDENQ